MAGLGVVLAWDEMELRELTERECGWPGTRRVLPEPLPFSPLLLLPLPLPLLPVVVLFSPLFCGWEACNDAF